MKKITFVFLFTMFVLVGNATFYVVPGGAGLTNGSSWDNAYGDIQTAINAASGLYVSSLTPQEVWVKTGTYSTSSAAIIMKESVSLYGGFDGTETDKTQRAKGANAWNYTNVTTLNGGAAKRCIESGAGNYTNVTIVDGFTITNGVGQGVQTAGAGGGAFIRYNLKLQNCIVTGNTATGNGGGVNVLGGIISNCWIYNNTGGAGGGFYSNTGTGAVTAIDNCLIERNTATTGGGFRAQGSLSTNIDRCNIRNNFSTGNGAEIYFQGTTGANVTNCLITNNTGQNVVYLISAKLINSTVANNEGGVYLASASTGELYNNIIVNNVTKGTTTAQGVSVTNGYAAGKVKNNATWPSVAYQTWGGATDSILTTNAATALSQVAFKSPVAFRGRVLSNVDSLATIASADWSVTSNSICLNKGDNTLIPAGINTDFEGISRTSSSFVDLGAYELPYYDITISFNAGGTVNTYTNGQIVAAPKGSQTVFTITPVSGKGIKSVLYNGVEVKTDLTDLIGSNFYFGGKYTAASLIANASLVVEFENDISTGNINNSSEIKLISSKNRIEIIGANVGTLVTVYNLSGTIVFSENINDQSYSLRVNPGIYFVKIGNKTIKISVTNK